MIQVRIVTDVYEWSKQDLQNSNCYCRMDKLVVQNNFEK